MAGFVPGGGTATSSSVTLVNPTITSVSLPTAGVFTTLNLSGIRVVRARLETGRITIKSAVAGVVWTLLPGESYETPDIPLASSGTLYFGSTNDNDTLYLETWT